jgi:hypothetical protein
MTRAILFMAALLAAAPGRAGADPAPVAKDIEFLGTAAREAVESALADVPLDDGAFVILRPAGEHRGNWFIEESLIEALRSRGVSVRLGAAVLPASGDSAAAAGTAGGGPATPLGLAEASETTGADIGGAPSGPTTLEFRVLEISLQYAGGERRFFVGSRRVDREAYALLRARLLRGSTMPEALWVGTGESRLKDRIRGEQMREVAGDPSNYPCPFPVLKPRGIGRLVEPVVVTAIVSGLVYLFYTNQN